jgi:hypothetical protein
MRTIGCLAVAALCASAGAHPLYLFGTVGASPAFATLERDGGHLSGRYLYLRHAKEIRLDGKIDAKGNFLLDEFDAKSGKKTGSFQGAANRTHWAGQWRSGSAAPLAFVLDEDRDTLAAVSGRFRCTTKWNDKQFGYLYTHSLDLTLAKGAVKGFKVERGETSKQGDDQSCGTGLEDLRQIPSDAGILLRSKADNPKDESAQHCTVRNIARCASSPAAIIYTSRWATQPTPTMIAAARRTRCIAARAASGPTWSSSARRRSASRSSSRLSRDSRRRTILHRRRANRAISRS